MIVKEQGLFEELSFRWPWRPYQQRVLDALEVHMADRRLHLVAAPGAGKTSLGLELFRRLGKTCLTFSPTRTIRNQWLYRLNDFLPEGSPRPDWTSYSLDTPALFTSVTYQALHSTYRDIEDPEEPEEERDVDKAPSRKELELLITKLKDLSVGTIILDEAHHLTQEWWKALSSVTEQLENLTLVSLTATPPYEVIGTAWKRYEELCGPIDEEISAPELVKSGTLCPHQDYVYATCPSKPDSEKIALWNSQVQQIIDALEDNELFISSIVQHPWLNTKQVNADTLLSDPELLVALLIFSKKFGMQLNDSLLELLNADIDELPEIDRSWWQVIIHRYLFDDQWVSSDMREEHAKELAKELRQRDLLYRRELRIDVSKKAKRILSLSDAKIDACVDIYKLEKNLRGDSLRQVYLTDYIREFEQRELGTYPVFRAILHAADQEKDYVANLTGRFIVISQSKLKDLYKIIPEEEVRIVEPLPEFPSFVQIAIKGENSRAVSAFTTLLENGNLHVLVGTHALLGEGWDAPVINSLILASFVGSYVLTNQMRGRAIRSVKDNPDKAASIWHPVSVDFTCPLGISDLLDLDRRFESFVGLSSSKNVIESGIKRLALPDVIKAYEVASFEPEFLRRKHAERFAKHLNNKTVDRFNKLDTLKARWENALDSHDEGQIIPATDVSDLKTLSPFYFKNTLEMLLTAALGAFAAVLVAVFTLFPAARESILPLAIAVLIALFFAAPKLFKVAKLLILCLPVDGSLRQIGLSIRDALCSADLIKTDPRRARVISKEVADGVYSIFLTGGTFYEKALFADCVEEILNPIENPRYLITRKGFKKYGGNLDYHAVPAPLAEKKELAYLFLAAWRRRFGVGELIYTRSQEGRNLLLKARTKAFSNAFRCKSKRSDRWS